MDRLAGLGEAAHLADGHAVLRDERILLHEERVLDLAEHRDKARLARQSLELFLGVAEAGLRDTRIQLRQVVRHAGRMEPIAELGELRLGEAGLADEVERAVDAGHDIAVIRCEPVRVDDLEAEASLRQLQPIYRFHPFFPFLALHSFTQRRVFGSLAVLSVFKRANFDSKDFFLSKFAALRKFQARFLKFFSLKNPKRACLIFFLPQTLSEVYGFKKFKNLP